MMTTTTTIFFYINLSSHFVTFLQESSSVREEFLPTRRPQTHWIHGHSLLTNQSGTPWNRSVILRRTSLQCTLFGTNTPARPDTLTHFCQSWTTVTEWILRVHPTHLVVLRTQSGSLNDGRTDRHISSFPKQLTHTFIPSIHIRRVVYLIDTFV